MHRMCRKHRQNSNRLYLVLPIVLSVIGGGGIFGYDFYDRQGRFISSRDSRQAWYKMADKIAEAKLKEAKRQILDYDFAGGLEKQKKSVNKPLCRARDPCMQICPYATLFCRCGPKQACIVPSNAHVYEAPSRNARHPQWWPRRPVDTTCQRPEHMKGKARFHFCGSAPAVADTFDSPVEYGADFFRIPAEILRSGKKKKSSSTNKPAGNFEDLVRRFTDGEIRQLFRKL